MAESFFQRLQAEGELALADLMGVHLEVDIGDRVAGLNLGSTDGEQGRKKNKGETIDPDMTILAEYLTAWIDGRADQLAPLSVTQYRSVVRNHVSKTPLGGMPLGRIREAHVRAHEQELQRKGLSASTRNVIRAVISRALADAVEDDLISTDPCAGRRRSGERQNKPKQFTVWTGDELRTLLDTAAGDRLEALWPSQSPQVLGAANSSA